jgi:hypothetical protein
MSSLSSLHNLFTIYFQPLSYFLKFVNSGNYSATENRKLVLQLCVVHQLYAKVSYIL